MKFAYADPPYLGSSKPHNLYKDHPMSDNKEIDHVELINRLMDEYSDGWALSASSSSLKYLLNLCPSDTRVLCWVKPSVKLPQGPVYPIYAWEPVILVGGRKHGEVWERPVDWVSVQPPTGNNRGWDFPGAKPLEFCFWVFRCLGALPGDSLFDVFPGSGAVGKAWDKYSQQDSLFGA